MRVRVSNVIIQARDVEKRGFFVVKQSEMGNVQKVKRRFPLPLTRGQPMIQRNLNRLTATSAVPRALSIMNPDGVNRWIKQRNHAIIADMSQPGATSFRFVRNVTRKHTATGNRRLRFAPTVAVLARYIPTVTDIFLRRDNMPSVDRGE